MWGVTIVIAEAGANLLDSRRSLASVTVAIFFVGVSEGMKE